ncbi:hypothetical protein [Paracoccus sp. J55]|uniref:hypothetical protein n=1 Tax=Paracoccus sp. J55 TaxID=935849 RepID=UPI0012EC41AB|nr:hypothetical protein [Paracoccus sp. J55]
MSERVSAMSVPPLATCVACGKRYRVLVQLTARTASYKCASCYDVTCGEMPELNKKIIYLDQLAISQIFKIRTNTYEMSTPHYAFWKEAADLLEQCVLLQQLLCPQSDIHRDESMVFQRGNELSLAHEMLGGDTRFQSTSDIEREQVWAYLEAFLSGSEPVLDLAVDEILDGQRNKWLSRFHVTATVDWSSFAKGVRDHRELAADNLAPLYERWRADPNASFKSVLKTELEAFGISRISAYSHFTDLARRGLENRDMESFMSGALSGPVREFREIRDFFLNLGVKVDQAGRQVVDFWNWPKNSTIPHHRIQAYLFAAMARKILAGQKKNPTRGATNDIRAIATYAPYVDAMFVDSEFATFLSEKPLMDDLTYRARIFSIRTQNAFLDYLRELVRSATMEIEMIAVALYGDGARRAPEMRTDAG